MAPVGIAKVGDADTFFRWRAPECSVRSYDDEISVERSGWAAWNTRSFTNRGVAGTAVWQEPGCQEELSVRL